MKEMSHVEFMKKNIAEIFGISETAVVYKGNSNYVAVLKNGKQLTLYKPTVRVMKVIKVVLDMKEVIKALKNFSEENPVRKCTELHAEVLDKALEGSYEIQ